MTRLFKVNRNFCSLIFVFFLKLQVCFALGGFTISTVANLSFGKIAIEGSGSVTMLPSGVRTKTGQASILSSGPGSMATFNITGPPGQAFIITLPSNSDVLLTANGTSARVTQFTVSPSTTGSLNASGIQIINIGATLNFNSILPPGNYNGNFWFAIDYQ